MILNEEFFDEEEYEGNYKEIVISITKMMYKNYPVVTCYMKDKSDVKIIATKIAYKL